MGERKTLRSITALYQSTLPPLAHPTSGDREGLEGDPEGPRQVGYKGSSCFSMNLSSDPPRTHTSEAVSSNSVWTPVQPPHSILRGGQLPPCEPCRSPHRVASPCSVPAPSPASPHGSPFPSASPAHPDRHGLTGHPLQAEYSVRVEKVETQIKAPI